jgi:hypothetical protein
MQGVKIVLAEQCWHKSLSPLMDAVRKEFKDVPTYITFDIDGVDPSCCPGTGNLIYSDLLLLCSDPLTSHFDNSYIDFSYAVRHLKFLLEICERRSCYRSEIFTRFGHNFFYVVHYST